MNSPYLISLIQRCRALWHPTRGLAIAEASVIGIVAAISAVLLKFGTQWLGQWRVQTTETLPAWIVLPTIGFCLAFLAGFLVERLAPEASGSGIPQVKATLANVPMRLSWRVAIVKLVSATIALGSGITLGRQGPTVQIGSGLAAGISRLVPTSPDHRRQMIAAGAGAGLSAAFNAPIAGVLFIVEELLQDLSGLTLGTAIIASFIGGVVSRLLGGSSLQHQLQSTGYSSSFSVPEIPFYLVLGIITGLLAALFNKGIIFSIKFYRRFHMSLPVRVAVAGMISGIVVALLPVSFHNTTKWGEFVLASSANPSWAAIIFFAEFMLTLVAFGSGAPGGLFAPSLVLGSTIGYLVGVCQSHFLGAASPITYALVGMGAFFSAVSKVPITAIVIVFEITMDFTLVLPLMIGSVTSYLIADKIFPGSLYNKILNLNGIDIEKDNLIEGILTNITAQEVMEEGVETLEAGVSVDEAVQAFSRSQHRGFPIVEDNKLVGIVTQSDLLKIRARNLIGNTSVREIMTGSPLTVSPLDKLSKVLYLLDRYQVSRLPVVESRRLVGIITYADIISAEANHLNGKNRRTEPRREPSYRVYQTQSPSTGTGRLLVPIANPDTAGTLLEMAAAIARDRHYEVECLQIILVSRNTTPAEAQVRTTKSRHLLRQAEFMGKRWKIPVHTQIRVAHDIAYAIQEIIEERHIDLMLMGWKGNTSTPGRIFGDVVDTLIHKATCDVVLVKLGVNYLTEEVTGDLSLGLTHKLSPKKSSGTYSFNRWFIPIAGGSNESVIIKLLPALMNLSNNPQPEIHLAQVFKPSESKPNMALLEQTSRQLLDNPKLNTTSVSMMPVKADSVSDGVIKLVKTERYDVVILGASSEGMLQHAIKGSISEVIATGVESTVILVRGASPR
ncbi:MAG: chloride channel protein [Rhizonema sp. NSF051]|nr:chloride channel protein [Rhizonema sp. NSF051]